MAIVDGGGGCRSHLIVLESLLAGVHTWQYVPEVVVMVRKNADGVWSGPSEGRGQRQPNNQHPSDCDNARCGPLKLR